MTPLKLIAIDPNDFPNWEEFRSYRSDNPMDDDAWFTITVGVDGEEGGNDFQVHVATPASIGRIKQASGGFRGLIVDEFTPEAVEHAIQDAVRDASGLTWQDGIDRLRKLMLWEYEEM